MSGPLETVKDIASSLTGQATASTEKGEFSKPSEFPTETQRGRGVGLQSDMKKQPASNLQEAEDGFTHYKAADKLAGKTALVTGGDSGIGRSVAVMYAMEGAHVAIIYLPEEEQDAQETSRLCQKFGGKPAICKPCDIRSETEVNTTIASIVSAFGGTLDILVNNASVMYDTKTLTDISTDQFDRTVKTNVYGTFFVTRAALPSIPKGGNIIVTVSQVAFSGSPTLLDYSMTKGAGVAFVRSLSQNLLEKGIRVNGVAPGPVWTPLQPAAMDEETLSEWHKSPAPMGRIGQPSELGPAYVFLASQDGSFISGQTIHVNGGKVVNS
ncbi:hypothetical protein YB2330_000009 [Saitoella coloradoensis]